MEKKNTSLLNHGMIWFGAGVSIAEILTGTYFAPLGFQNALLAILLGHLIGGVIFFLAALIGAREKKSAMETTKIGFGKRGGIFFAILNVLQLVGWTAIMIYDGALAAKETYPLSLWIWALAIGIFILIWIVFGITDLGSVNTAAMVLLFVLTLILCKVIFWSGRALTPSTEQAMSFGLAVELAATMPLSWLPVVADYTRHAEKPVAACLTSTLVYHFVSVWMYLIGMGAALFTSETDIAKIMIQAGLGMAGLLIIIFSTVTTTFLDAYSAGVSMESITQIFGEKTMAILATILGTGAAMVYPMDDITEFLYFIGSVFAPMMGVLIIEYFVYHRDHTNEKIHMTGMVVWLLGFIFYRFMLTVNSPVGTALPTIFVTMLLAWISGKILPQKK